MEIIEDVNQKLDCLKTIQLDVTSLKDSINELIKAVKCSESKLCDAYSTIKSLQTVNNMMKEDLSLLRAKTALLHRKITDQDDNSRINNIIISGIGETPKENCFSKVHKIFQHIEGKNVMIQRCHRIGSAKHNMPRDLKVCLVYYQDKIEILRRRSQLPKGVFINEDYSPETKRNMNTLRPVFKEAIRKDPNSKLNKGQLFYQEKQYSVSNIKSIPMNTEKLSEKNDIKTAAFAGRLSPLSKLYPTPMQIDNRNYNSCEQYYQYEKCMSEGNIMAAEAVLLAQEPEDATAAGRVVQKPKEWIMTEGKKIMKKAASIKFKTTSMKIKLRLTEHRLIVDATRNPIWGIGVPFNSPSALNPGHYIGHNLMGVILMELRRELEMSDEALQNSTEDTHL